MNKVIKTGCCGLLLAAMLIASGCDETGGEEDMPAKYTLTVYNITNGQPLTPVAAILHDNGYTPWTLGDPVSVALEKLAESGDTTDFMDEADSNPAVLDSETSTGGPFAPGGSVSVELEADPGETLKISAASMLANTNDAFTGVDSWDIGMLKVGETATVYTRVFDAGTEANTESAGTIPGPADGGEGFNAQRETLDKLVIHPGVVTADDGLTTSVLNESHRWSGPAAKLTVTRTQ